MVLGARVCSHPAERWFHGAAAFNDSTMIVFGGFGPLCGDYCNDVWLFDFSDNTWTEMMELGNSVSGPGKRFKFSTVVVQQIMYVFGGFRLWHGFAHENSVENDWSSFGQYPRGGFLNDLWAYDKSKNSWTNVSEQAECPTITADEQLIEVECVVEWPSARAGHAAAVLDGTIFVHGGHRTFFPYPTTASTGAGRGTLSLMRTSAAYTPYPTHPYYLDDLWQFNVSTGKWTRVLTSGTSKPDARMDHSMVAAANAGVVVLMGGYVSNYYFDDTWQFNVSTSRVFAFISCEAHS
jgi:N-acetylneuraminic acid mutarotase